jgi:hypothetical protein
MAQVPSSYWGEIDERLWFEMSGCDGRHFFVEGTPHVLGRLYAYCPAKETIERVSRSDVTASSDEAGYFMRGYLSGSEPAPPTGVDGSLIDDQTAVDDWLEAVEIWRLTGEWTGDR